MNQELTRLESFGPPGGIDQSRNPAPNTVRDARNVDSHGEYWTLRPGWQYVSDLSSYIAADGDKLICDFSLDEKYPLKFSGKLIIVSAEHYNNSNYQDFLLIRPGTGSVLYESLWPSQNGFFRHVGNALVKFKNILDVYEYTPTVIFYNGIDQPLWYCLSRNYGTGTLELQAIDGGDSDISYLSQVPIAKVMVQYKSRIFALNTSDAGNRMYWTAPDSSGVFTANVWPAGYNLDLGDQQEITAAIPFRDNLVVFKEHEIWLLGGDGVGGLWDVQQVDNQHGCVSQDLVVDVGDSLVFVGRDGIYRWAGGAATRISHPKIENLWNTLQIGDFASRRDHAVYDSEARRVIFYLSTETTAGEGDGYLVYNLERNTWDVWEMLPGDIREGYSGITESQPSRIYVSKYWNKRKAEVLGCAGTKLYIMRPGQPFDNWENDDTKARTILWYMRTPDYMVQDSDTKLLRNIALDIANTGNWDLTVIPLLKNENPREAIYRGLTHSVLVDSNVNNIEHQTAGSNDFSINDYVEIFYGPMFVKHHTDSLAAVSGESIYTYTGYTSYSGKTDVIKSNSDHDATDVNRKLLSVDGISDVSLWGTDTWGDFLWTNPEVKRVMLGCNLVGRQFALLLTNMNENNNGINSAGKYGSNLMLGGWGLWLKRRRALRA